jgi:hypothetical protein
VSTQPISDERLAEITRASEGGFYGDTLAAAALRDVLAALVAVRAERDRLILAIRSHAPKQADAIIDVAAVSSPGEQDERANSHEQTINAWKSVSSPGEETP